MNYSKNIKLSYKLSSSVLVLSLFSMILFYSCGKEDDDSQHLNTAKIVSQASSDIMTFNSIDEYREAKTDVLQMTFEELEDYEESKGFTSIGRVEDEFYNNIIPESFNDIEEVKEFTANNSEYIKLVEDEEGEQELVTINENNSDRYFMNNDGMYQVEDIVYKVLSDEVTLSTQAKNIDELKQLDLNNYKTNITSEFTIYTLKSTVTNNSQITLRSSGCGEEARKLQTNGKNRTEVKAYYEYIKVDGQDADELEVRLRIKNQKKSALVWFAAKRTTSYDLHAKYNFYNVNTSDWETYQYDKAATDNYFAKREWSLLVADTDDDHDNHIDAYDMWCDNPSIDEIDIECNASAL